MKSFRKFNVLMTGCALLTAAAVLLGAGKKGLNLSGSTTVLPIAQKAAEKYMDLNASANLSVRGGGSGVGIAALIDGSVDIANSSRPMKTAEIALARSKGVNPVENVIANDGLSIVVHKDNPVNELSLETLKKIYSGEISSWKDVGGPTTGIVVISRDVSSGTFESFNTLVMKGAKVSDGAMMVASNQAAATTVAQTPGGIAYAGLGYVSADLKVLKINGVMPSVQTVQSKEYPLSRKLYMYTNGTPKGMAQEFINYILSADGQKLVQETGFVPLK